MGRVYLGTVRGLLVREAGARARQLVMIPLGSAVYGTPCAANGTQYVASQRHLYAAQRDGD